MPKILPITIVETENTGQIVHEQGQVLSHVESINLDFHEKELQERAKQMHMQYGNLQIFPINPDALRIISPKEAVEFQAIPFFLIGKKLRLAVVDPHIVDLLVQQLQGKGYDVELVLISEKSFQFGVGLYALHRIENQEVKTYALDDQQKGLYEEQLVKIKALQKEFENMPEHEAIDKMIFSALQLRASDIHMEPEVQTLRIRFRIDGVLTDMFELSMNVHAKFLMHMKFRAQMKMNIARLPQDGKFVFFLKDRQIDIRMSCLPTEFGEAVVLRLLDAKKSIVPLVTLGFTGMNLAYVQKALEQSSGMILVTGPTGSGKTTTLYSLLSLLNTPDVKMITLEDPVEYHLPGVSQSQIHEDEGYTFASGLRSILRQDPDIIMVGEIRDLPTAETAVQAALTGHRMLSTVHTNSAVETIPRMLYMGVKPYLLAPSLSCIVAQRLVRNLCPHCKQIAPITSAEKQICDKVSADVKARFGGTVTFDVPTQMYHAVGCAYCHNTGYVGQMGIMEVLRVTSAVQDVILQGAASHVLLEKALEEGMMTMKEDGVVKAMQGMTTLEEVMRVAGNEG